MGTACTFLVEERFQRNIWRIGIDGVRTCL